MSSDITAGEGSIEQGIPITKLYKANFQKLYNMAGMKIMSVVD